jgi:hypothetical protein
MSLASMFKIIQIHFFAFSGREQVPEGRMTVQIGIQFHPVPNPYPHPFPENITV